MGTERDAFSDEDEGVLAVDIPEDDLDAEVPHAEATDPPQKANGGEARAPQSARTGAAAVLQKQLEEMKRKTERTEKLAENLSASQRRATEEVARTRQENSNIKRIALAERRTTIESEIATIDTALEEAEAAYARAFEGGQGVELAKAQRRISELTVRKSESERRKAELPSDEQLAYQERPKSQDEAIEQYIGQFKPRSQGWLRAHPECVTDRNLNQKVINADKLAIRAGLEPESDEYFDFIDEKMGFGDDDQGEPRPEPRRQQQETTVRRTQQSEPITTRRANTPVRPSAPVRGGSGLQVQGMRRVQLTQGEIDSATDGTLQWNYNDPSGKNRWKKGDPIGVNEMARRKAAMKSRYMAPNES